MYAGPTPKRTGHCLIMSRVFGRTLKEGEGELLPAALEALRAMHACGVVHGDIRAPNFLVVSGNGNRQHVVVIGACVNACERSQLPGAQGLGMLDCGTLDHGRAGADLIHTARSACGRFQRGEAAIREG